MEAEELNLAQVARRDVWDPAQREATRERLRRDMRRRHVLGPRQRSVLDGLVHALKPGAMNRSFPDRILLAYDLGNALRPAAGVIAVGEPTTATHMTWQVSGMGVFVHTAMWGSAREAGQLWAAQREAGAEDPCVVSWLGYQPPGPWGVLSGRHALRGGARLARHIAGWFDHRATAAAHRSASTDGTRAVGSVHTAIEAHSYGTLVAVRALQILQRRTPPISMDALVVTGPVGLPHDLAGRPDLIGMTEDTVFLALTDSDLLSRLGLRLSGRRPWSKVTRLKTAADEALDLAAAVGHNTSRFRPDAGPFHRGHGYRDVGTVSLHGIARATAGVPLD